MDFWLEAHEKRMASYSKRRAELEEMLAESQRELLRDTLPQDRLRVIHGGLCGGKDQPDTARRSTADLVLVKSRERSITST